LLLSVTSSNVRHRLWWGRSRKKMHFYRQRTILRYSSTVIEEKKNSGRMIRFIRREKRDYILLLLLLLLRPLFFLYVYCWCYSTSKRARGHMYVRLYSINVCAFKKQSKEQKKWSLSFAIDDDERKKKELYICHSSHLEKRIYI